MSTENIYFSCYKNGVITEIQLSKKKQILEIFSLKCKKLFLSPTSKILWQAYPPDCRFHSPYLLCCIELLGDTNLPASPPVPAAVTYVNPLLMNMHNY